MLNRRSSPNARCAAHVNRLRPKNGCEITNTTNKMKDANATENAPVSRSSSVMDMQQFMYLFSSPSLDLSLLAPKPQVSPDDFVARKLRTGDLRVSKQGEPKKRSRIFDGISLFFRKSDRPLTLRNWFVPRSSDEKPAENEPVEETEQPDQDNYAGRASHFGKPSTEPPTTVPESYLSSSSSTTSKENAVFSPGIEREERAATRSISEQIFDDESDSQPSETVFEKDPPAEYCNKISRSAQLLSPAGQSIRRMRDRVSSLHVHWLSPIPRTTPSAGS